MINSVLVLCTGNICRSPLAEYEIKHRAPHMRVASAGIGALVGEPAQEHAVEVGRKHGLDLSAHRARQLDTDLVHAYDLILVMEQHQARWVRQSFPQAQGRVFLLGHWHDMEEVPDPYQQSLAQFEAVYAQIERHVAEWLERLDPVRNKTQVEFGTES